MGGNELGERTEISLSVSLPNLTLFTKNITKKGLGSETILRFPFAPKEKKNLWENDHSTAMAPCIF